MEETAYILDFNVLAEQNLSVDEFMFLLQFYRDGKNMWDERLLESLEEKQFIKIDNKKNIHIREKGKLLIEFLSIEGVGSTKEKKNVKKSSRAINLELNEFIQEYRLLWKGLKPGSMGSEGACRDKLYRWMQDNPNYSKEQILNAAKMYLKSVENYQFLQQADYFIYKKDAFGENSRLSAFIDDTENAHGDNWTSHIN